MTSEDSKDIIHSIFKELRKETGVGIKMCYDAANESHGDLNRARVILSDKCIKLGEKYYGNPEKKPTFFGIHIEESNNTIKIIKIGCESDFLIATPVIETLSQQILKLDGNNNDEIIPLLQYQCGMVRERLDLVSNIEINKNDDEHFYIMKTATPNNTQIYSNITVIKYKGENITTYQELSTDLQINLHGICKKNIINHHETKPVNYHYQIANDELLRFLQHPLLTDKTKRLEQLFKDRGINLDIISIYVV